MSNSISIFLPDLRGGGAEKMHLEMARNWKELGCKVEIILIQNSGELAQSVPEGVSVFTLNQTKIHKCILPLVRRVRETKPDILIGVMWPLSILAIVAGFFTKTKIVVSDHNTLSKSYSSLSKMKFYFLRITIGLLYPFASLRRVVSKGMIKDLVEISGLNENDFYVLYNPAANNNLEGKVKKKPSEIEGGKLNILCVGSLKKQKNYEMLIDAVNLLPQDFKVRVNILGEGSLRKELNDKINFNGLSDKIHLLGFRENTADYFHHSDLFVLTSSYEGFGNVIVESLNAGTPVISTDCPSGPCEILEGGKYGTLIPVDDRLSLRNAIVNFSKDDHCSSALKNRANDFSSDKISKAYLMKFKELLK